MLYQTDANVLEHYFQREYTRLGYAVCYYPADVEDRTYKGAYTETVATPCTVYQEVFAPDFASLYPNVMRSRNMCLTTYREEGSNTTWSVYTGDDQAVCEEHVHFEREGGLIPAFIADLFGRRKELKAILSTEKKGSSAWHRANTLQLAVKVCMNTLYGLTGNRRSPLFWLPLGASVTAFARTCTTTARDLIVKRGHTFLAADTDSIFAVMAAHVMDYATMDQEMKAINGEVQTALQSPYLSLEVEEVIRRVSFMDGRKTYVCLLEKGKEWRQWTRGCPL